ncbi:MAG TPA: S26 family signal peptidase [Methanospirillum sp.]|uniref:S26 family signal peptidase n=1 Tax=Methanospirillum sp. TaxID=45200 RepID=UPI002C26F29E|nr:S26 family signal peptidase [Methanospirillum sp.]HWQ63267.1 S26 family signal peptidase [Methanospirillum sp.]
MAAKSEKKPIKTVISDFWKSEEQIPSAVREIASVLVTVGIIVAILFLGCGTWPAIVTIESESMVPHMNVGDLVLVVAADRLGPLQSMAEGNVSGYQKYSMPGDVIIYHPNGNTDLHPIIHRALYWVEAGPTNITYREMNKASGQVETKQYVAPHAGYITKGDNNPVIDQTGFGDNYRGTGSAIQPVKKEWIVGKAVYSVPYVGYLPLNIGPVIVIVIALMILQELYTRRKNSGSQNKTQTKKK